MAFDAFIKIEGVPGESTDDKHKGEIEILNYGFGASQPQSGTASSSGNLGTSRVNIQNFSFTHHLDVASAKLFEYCCNGTVAPTAVISLCRAGGEKQKYMEYKLSDVVVTSVGRGGDAKGDEDVPIESVTLAFGKVEMVYKKLGMDGKPAGNHSAGWDLKANAKV